MASSDAPLAIDRAGLYAAFARTRAAWPHPRRLHSPPGAIVLDEFDATAELPVGWTDVQEAVDERSRKLRARLVKPLAGRPAGPEAGPLPSP